MEHDFIDYAAERRKRYRVGAWGVDEIRKIDEHSGILREAIKCPVRLESKIRMPL